jgi:hypothetical protein
MKSTKVAPMTINNDGMCWQIKESEVPEEECEDLEDVRRFITKAAEEYI